MKRLPSQAVTALSEARRRHFVRWMMEWEIERALREDDADEPAPSAARRVRAPRAAKAAGPAPDPMPGLVWLAHPSLVPDCPRPLYLVLLADPEQGWLHLAPFGAFSAPACDGELLLRHPVGPLRVVCLWNRRRLPVAALRRGWPAGRLRADDLADLRTWLDCRAALRALPPALKDRTGPSIVPPDDPRDPYTDEETGWLDALADAALAAAGDGAERPAGAGENAADAGPLAAEPPTDYAPAPRRRPSRRGPPRGPAS